MVFGGSRQSLNFYESCSGGRGSLNGRIRGTCTRILLKVRSIRHFLCLLRLSKTSVYVTLKIILFCPIAYFLFQPFSFWGRLILFFINGIASMKRLSVSHDFGHNTNNHLDRQEQNVIQRLSSVPESVMWVYADHENALWWPDMKPPSKKYVSHF